MAANTRRRITLPPTPSDEHRPLLSRLYSDYHGTAGETGDQVYSCMTNPHSHLPVYTNIHRIRRDITSVVEDYLSLEQLRDVRINVTVIRPLVDKLYELEDISIVYCLLVNRAQFLLEESYSSTRHNVNWTRATLCELIATRILRRFGEDHEGADGLLLLSHILVAGFEPFQNAPDHIREEAEAKTSWTFHRTLPCLEVAILTESKHFLSSSTCHHVVSAIYEGRIIYTPSTFWDIIPDHYKLKPISLYDPRESPLLNQYRLIVPRNRNILEQVQFAFLLTLYIGVMLVREEGKLTVLEAAFAVYAFGWGLDQFATILAHGWIHGFRLGLDRPGEQAFDVLALAAPVLIPRVAFTLLSDNLIFLCLRSMMVDFFFLTALSDNIKVDDLYLVWAGWYWHSALEQTEFHWLLGPSLMVAFAFLGNTLFLTILVSMLSNTFSNISANATSEIQFRRAVLTLEGVKADAVFAYQPPFNLLAVFFLLPLKFVVSPRWFHKIHVATVRLVNLPLLLLIAVAERRLLWPSKAVSQTTYPRARKWFWQKWQLSAHRYLRAVFQVPPPEGVHRDIAVDDHLTHHLIRRQFTRQTTAEGPVPQLRKASRRDSMFPHKMRGSFDEDASSAEAMASKMQAMEKSMQRMELLLSKLVSVEDEAIVDGSEDGLDESGTLRESMAGITAESTFVGQGD
ncbi:hypothetical protein QQS21_011056 [Conoideocrella luteorostrata]|uniref:Nonselective cation channel n=1 Tax=Conoideocrella luteorostrata TaxID=1105319 RepID=A0AAJ0CDT5_9HYPO|nr:hypothetical protein QQS21_011056 [Conoideocrella luteorostrata]